MDDTSADDKTAAPMTENDHIQRLHSHAQSTRSTHSYHEKQRELIHNQHPEVLSDKEDGEDEDDVSHSSDGGTRYKYIQWSTQPSEYCADPDDLPKSIRRIDNPLEWSEKKKNVILFVSCCETWVAAYAASGYTSGISQMEAEWGVSRVALLVGVTLFTCGFAVAPMFLAPLSEVFGRQPVFIASYAVFLICHLWCALSQSFASMLVARFFTGIGGSTFSTIIGGVIADVYEKEQRGFPMSCFAAAALFGTGLGPLCSGFIAQHLNWRWIHWVQLIFNGVGFAVVCLVLKETRGSALLSKKARLLNKWLDEREAAQPEKGGPRIRWKCKEDEERDLAVLWKVSLVRPFYLLFTEPVVFWFSLWVSFSWGILYLFLQGIPLVFEESHGFNQQQSGAVFSALCIGSIIALILNVCIDKAMLKFSWLPDPSSVPETRLYCACLLGTLLPIGMFWFGWTSFPDQHWILPALAVGCATIGIYSIYLAVFNYLTDIYKKYASSVMAAQSFCRNALAGGFPLFTAAMYHKLTFQGASSLLGGIGFLLSVVPWVLIFFGSRIRARSAFASEI